jgi:hypothetical protein
VVGWRNVIVDHRVQTVVRIVETNLVNLFLESLNLEIVMGVLIFIKVGHCLRIEKCLPRVAKQLLLRRNPHEVPLMVLFITLFPPFLSQGFSVGFEILLHIFFKHLSSC